MHDCFVGVYGLSCSFYSTVRSKLEPIGNQCSHPLGYGVHQHGRKNSFFDDPMCHRKQQESVVCLLAFVDRVKVCARVYFASALQCVIVSCVKLRSHLSTDWLFCGVPKVIRLPSQSQFVLKWP